MLEVVAGLETWLGDSAEFGFGPESVEPPISRIMAFSVFFRIFPLR